MENLGLEQIKNLPVYKCEVSKELTVMKRGLNSRAIVGENLHVKNYLWKSKEKEAKANRGGDVMQRKPEFGDIKDDQRRGTSLWEKMVSLHKREIKTVEVQNVSETGSVGKEECLKKDTLLFFFKLSLFYVLVFLASEAGGILFPKRTEGLGWEADKHFTICIVLLGLLYPVHLLVS